MSAWKDAIIHNINLYLEMPSGAYGSSPLADFQRAIARFDSMDAAMEHFWSTLQYHRDGAILDAGEHVEPYLAERGVTTDVRDALKLDPIPGWAIERLAQYASSQVELARRLDVDPSTVRRWIAPDSSNQSRKCSGMSARVVRAEAPKIIEWGSTRGILLLTRHRYTGDLSKLGGPQFDGLHIDEARERAPAELESRDVNYAAFETYGGQLIQLDEMEALEVGEHEAF